MNDGQVEGFGGTSEPYQGFSKQQTTCGIVADSLVIRGALCRDLPVPKPRAAANTTTQTRQKAQG